ncbi:MAG TPA: beta-ketoacyl synthase N-terminal-like domain-containing protein [Luteibaculaceae bacterium]|nr:beta-ketoacyl synthase N-terminal-like domain-containing protein [Luteibaculaceae bacterium]
MIVDLAIESHASVSPLGINHQEIWQSYLTPNHAISINDEGDWVGRIDPSIWFEIDELRTSDPRYRTLDPSTLLAIFTARQLNLKATETNFGVNIGSSRGATSSFEYEHHWFLEHGKSRPHSSPNTTLGNISSWVGQDLQSKGIAFSHSITCSTALHAIANACAWIKAGFSKSFIAGGAETPLTPFTLAQMKAMKIYSAEQDPWPCKALRADKKKNTLVLGEGCGLAVISHNIAAPLRIKSIGYSAEKIDHGSSISDEGESLYQSMKMAMEGLSQPIDAIVMHAPGTIKGDTAEWNAIDRLFAQRPLLTGNKWKMGHSFGASGSLSLEMALLMLKNQVFIGLPWDDKPHYPAALKQIMINAIGFGGNAISIVIEKAA